jgi:hypothetical protein
MRKAVTAIVMPSSGESPEFAGEGTSAPPPVLLIVIGSTIWAWTREGRPARQSAAENATYHGGSDPDHGFMYAIAHG